MKNLAILLIDIYKCFSFLLYPGGACKFSPTCAEYTRDEIANKGFVKGIIMGTRRLLSCR